MAANQIGGMGEFHCPIFGVDDVGATFCCMAEACIAIGVQKMVWVGIAQLGLLADPEDARFLSLAAVMRVAEKSGDVDAVELQLGRASRTGASDALRDLRAMSLSGVERTLIAAVGVSPCACFLGANFEPIPGGAEMPVKVLINITASGCSVLNPGKSLRLSLALSLPPSSSPSLFLSISTFHLSHPASPCPSLFLFALHSPMQ
jgi:hypothetical protein